MQTTKKQIQDLLIAQQQRSLPAFYCCSHGIVRPLAGKSSSRLDERSLYLCSRAEILAEVSVTVQDDKSIPCDPLELAISSVPTVSNDGANSGAETEDDSEDLEAGLGGDESSLMDKREGSAAEAYDTSSESLSTSDSMSADETS